MTDDAVAQELGRRLERARLDRNLSQERLAAAAGIGKATLERLEAGRPSKLPTVIRVLRALDLLDRLDAVLPSTIEPSPLDLARRRRARARAAPTRKPSGEPQRPPWGDET